MYSGCMPLEERLRSINSACSSLIHDRLVEPCRRGVVEYRAFSDTTMSRAAVVGQCRLKLLLFFLSCMGDVFVGANYG